MERVSCGRGSLFYICESQSVRSAKQAFDILSARWPVSDGKAYIAALEACEGVHHGHVQKKALGSRSCWR
ncbi:DUF982 domain-containing protein [Rhizobium leguminosarum]|uniref:DUF982 domain-containing protein n=1 Tax=Rhizobium leguminosarum TaxID=384 RepID=UPI003CFC02A8